jgi:UDP-2,3-diacylglucosamine pyrophosphatase LpxH
MAQRARFRTVFISDLHLGAAGARADDVAAFLKSIDCDTLYLVGDILDMWRLRKRWLWPEANNRVVRRLLKLGKRGTRIVYIPGNHDDPARRYAGLNFGGVEVALHSVHTTADGRSLLVTHGDQFDLVVRNARLLSALGAWAYDWLVRLNRHYNRLRSALGLDYWSLSQYIKLKVKSACTHISRFEDALIEEARRSGHAGVVCGHIHKAEVREVGGVAYYNCGDWVESCTALVEHADGRLEVIDGFELTRRIAAAREASRIDLKQIEEEVESMPLPNLPTTDRWRELLADQANPHGTGTT